MKKTAIVLGSVVILGGVAFGLTQSDMLQGRFSNLNQGNQSFGEIEQNQILPEEKNTCESDYYMELYLTDSNGDPVLSVSNDAFSVLRLNNVNVSDQWAISNDEGKYKFEFVNEGTPDEKFIIEVHPIFYEEASKVVPVNDTCSDVRLSEMIELTPLDR